MKIGSETHKELFCQSFIESHRQYEPDKLPWPEMNGAELEILQSIPFWKQALQVEQKAGILVNTFAETIDDPLIREAVDMQGKEEARHAHLIRHVTERYQIEVEEPPEVVLPDNLKPGFTRFGYRECLDSFLAFGLFELASEALSLPEDLLQIFDTVLDEEARHITFFVNWIAYEQVQRGQGVAMLRRILTLWHYGEALTELIGLVRESGKPSNSTARQFATANSDLRLNNVPTNSPIQTNTQNTDSSIGMSFVRNSNSLLDGLTLDRFLSSCIQANQKRMAQFDERLLQPSLLPILTKVLYRSLNLFPF